MKIINRKIKLLMALCFTLVLPLGVFAAVPDIYVCSTGEVNLAYSGTYVLVTGDKVVWQKVDAAGAPIPSYTAQTLTYNGTASSTNLLVTGTTDLTTTGEHFWKAHVVSADPAACTGDVSNAIDIYMLPAFTVDVTPETSAYCVEGTTNTTKTVVTAAATIANSATLPTGVVLAYNWTGTTAGAGAVDGTDPKKFNMTATTVGTYTVVSNVVFDVTATGKTLKSPASGVCTATDSAEIKAAPKPGTPVITVS
ncbi:hypothetical protein [Pedobacter metabolipauper]|uniref:Ig-like domain-containing protein n=1 Tax=Pedobacter metabolipauper TaxID=425513 RepID=A0A4R6SQ72_9SPHI|nr:hypothetical protein [Pedobacter metabolipauper]TDQ06374.1 hypothetical protein ATK78_4444 [Pedobacter metabolipauper]